MEAANPPAYRPGLLTQIKSYIPYFHTGFCYAVATELTFRTAQSALQIFSSNSFRSFFDSANLTCSNLLGVGLFYYGAGRYFPKSGQRISPPCARILTFIFIAKALWHEKTAHALTITKCIRAFRPIAKQFVLFGQDINKTFELHTPLIVDTTRMVYTTHIKPRITEIKQLAPKTTWGKLGVITLLVTPILVAFVRFSQTYTCTNEENQQIAGQKSSKFSICLSRFSEYLIS